MKRLFLLLLLSALLLTACHTDNDPWPTAGELTGPTVTSVPTATPVPSAAPQPTATPQVDAAPGING